MCKAWNVQAHASVDMIFDDEGGMMHLRKTGQSALCIPEGYRRPMQAGYRYQADLYNAQDAT